MILIELLKTSFAKWEWAQDEHADAAAHLNIGGSDIAVGFNIVTGKTVSQRIKLSEKLLDKRFASVSFTRDGQNNITNQGNATQILSTVVQICKEFVHDHKLAGVVFTAKANEPSRIRLYERISRRLGSSFQKKESGKSFIFLVII